MDQAIDYRSSVDTSSPFRSVKEAVSILDERFSTMQIFSPKHFSPSPNWTKQSTISPSPRNSSCGHDSALVETVRKLEAELDRTKEELKEVKERGSKIEAILASLKVELRRSMSEVAWAAAAAKSSSGEKRSELVNIGRMSDSPLPSLAQVLSFGENESLINVGRKKERKKKPIIPLLGRWWIFKKKRPTDDVDNPLYACSPLHWN